MKKLTLPQNDWQSFTALGGFNLVMTSYFLLLVCGLVWHFGNEYKAHVCYVVSKSDTCGGDIFNLSSIIALKRFTKSCKYCWCVEKIIASTTMIYVFLCLDVLSTLSMTCCHIAGDMLRPIPSFLYS